MLLRSRHQFIVQCTMNCHSSCTYSGAEEGFNNLQHTNTPELAKGVDAVSQAMLW